MTTPDMEPGWEKLNPATDQKQPGDEWRFKTCLDWFPVRHFNTAMDGRYHIYRRRTTSPEETSGEQSWRTQLYSGSQMLEAWVAGRDNLRKWGDGDGDKPDFASWIKGLATTSPEPSGEEP